MEADPNVASAAKLDQSFDDATLGAASTGNDTNYPFDAETETAQLHPTGTAGRGVPFAAPTRQGQAAIVAIAARVRTQKGDIAAESLGNHVSPDALAQSYVAYSPGQGGTADFGPNPCSRQRRSPASAGCCRPGSGRGSVAAGPGPACHCGR